MSATHKNIEQSRGRRRIRRGMTGLAVVAALAGSIVLLRSDFIDLSSLSGDGNPKAIKNLSWDADLPPDTRLQLRSRSGSALEEIHTFFDKK